MKKLFTLTALAALLAFTSTNSKAVSHAEFDALLKRYVSTAGNVNYKGLKNDHATLKRYLSKLESNAPSSDWSNNEKMAYWINAYNAYTIDLILSNYPVKKITDLYGGKPWDVKNIKIGGKTYSLNDIEHNILRKMDDPRIHFGIVCASYSCPQLRNEAFTAAKLTKQLDEQARKFINDPRRNKITASNVRVSEIFNWFKDDFTTEGTLIEYLNKYSKVNIKEDARVTYLPYNWSLNE